MDNVVKENKDVIYLGDLNIDVYQDNDPLAVYQNRKLYEIQDENSDKNNLVRINKLSLIILLCGPLFSQNCFWYEWRFPKRKNATKGVSGARVCLRTSSC